MINKENIRVTKRDTGVHLCCKGLGCLGGISIYRTFYHASQGLTTLSYNSFCEESECDHVINCKGVYYCRVCIGTLMTTADIEFIQHLIALGGTSCAIQWFIDQGISIDG